MNRSFSLYLTLMVLPLELALPTSARADKIDDFIKAEMQKRRVPGLSLAIFQDGKMVKVKGYGVLEKGSKTPVTPATLFQAGSISKPVAALAALHLVEKGQLALDEDVNAKLTTWKMPENEFTREQKVTLRRLLSHTAGLTVHGFPGYAADETVPTLVSIFNGEKPANTPAIRVDVTPGTLWRYSGGGYTLMQQMALDVTGKPYPQFMQETVLTPLGMTSSSYSQPLPEDRAKMTAAGHLGDRSRVKGRWHVYPEMAAAGLWTTPSDLARFAIEIQHSLAGKSNKVISQEMTRQMLTAQKDSVGLGLFLEGSEGSRRFGHNGRDEGFDAFLTAYATTGQGAVIMINANDNSRMISRLIKFIAKEYQWPDYPPFPSASHPPVKVDPKTLEAYTGRYEFANNQMLTLVAEKGRLLTQADGLPDEELIAETEDRFYLPDREGRMTFLKDSNGLVTGLRWAMGTKERNVPRVGPLVHTLKPQTDPDPTQTQKVEAALKALAQGDKAVEEATGISPGAKKIFARGVPDFAPLQSVTYLGEENVAGRGIERHKAKVARIRYYKILVDKSPRYVLVHLTADGLVADFDLVED